MIKFKGKGGPSKLSPAGLGSPENLSLPSSESGTCDKTLSKSFDCLIISIRLAAFLFLLHVTDLNRSLNMSHN